MPDRMGIRVYLAVAIALITAAMGAAFGIVAGRWVAVEIAGRIADNLAQSATQIGQAIDREIVERVDDLDVFTTTARDIGIDSPEAMAKVGIAGMQAGIGKCSWSGVADLAGRLAVASGDGPRVGEDIGKTRWFAKARQGRTIMDESGSVANPAELPRLVIAEPLSDKSGRSFGVIACVLGAPWGVRVAARLLPAVPDQLATDIMVTTQDFRRVLMPIRSAEVSLPGELAAVAPGKQLESYELTWPDGRRYLTVATAKLAATTDSGLDWRVVARRETDVALTPARSVRNRFFFLGGTLALAGALIGLFAAHWISMPLRRIADAARRIGAGELGVPIPAFGYFREVAVLSVTLRGMISSLRETAARLTTLNANLEERVRVRTAEIAEAHLALVRQESKLWAVIQTAMDGVMIIDDQDRIEIFNAACERIFGWKAEEILGHPVSELLADDGRSLRGGQLVMDDLVDPLPLGDPAAGQARTIRGLRRDGTRFPLEVSLSRASISGSPIYVAIMRDVTDAIQARDQLFIMATQDALTGVRNRRYFLEGAEGEFARARRHSRGYSILLIDADHFKAINDTFGHAAGDAALKCLGDICRRNVREVDLVGRLGGEEFAIAMPEAELTVAQVVAERLRQQTADSMMDCSGQTLRFTISIGVVAAEETDRTLEDLLRRADRALYEAKNGGRNRVAVATTRTGEERAAEPSR